MKYLVLDDEVIAAEYLAALIRDIDEGAEIVIVGNSVDSLKLVKEQEIRVCFIDIQMPGLNGIEFARELKVMNPKTNFIFVTGYSEHMGEAFGLDASDYIMKPASEKQVRHALENLRYPIEKTDDEAAKTEKRIHITCFGNFDILIDDNPVKFKFDKTKELLAYIVHRKGARCTTNEIMAALWENEGHESYYRMLKKDLQDSLNLLGCGEIVYSERGRIGLSHLECIECDYFKWAENSDEGRNLYHGEYMAQYSWAEDVNALIEREKYHYY